MVFKKNKSYTIKSRNNPEKIKNGKVLYFGNASKVKKKETGK